MNKFSLRNLKKNFLPLFFVLTFLIQPVFVLGAGSTRVNNQAPIPQGDGGMGEDTDYMFPGAGVDDSGNVNVPDSPLGSENNPLDFGSLGADPFSSPDGPDPFLSGGDDDFTPGEVIGDGQQQKGLLPYPDDYTATDQYGNPVDLNGDGQAAAYANGDILLKDGTEAPYRDSDSIGSSADRDLATTIRNVQRSTVAQAQAYANGTGSSTTQGAGSIPGSAGACIAGKLLSTILASTITAAINTIVGTAETVIGTAIGLLSVPVADWNVKLDTLRTKEQLQFNNAAQIGTSAGIPGSINALVNVSWNSVGYCIINSMIDYIARSTIAWAKSGFKGNPAFIENPGQFFKDIGNIEASSFLNTLAYGVLGQNICQPFRAQIVLTIARDYLDSNGSGYYGSAGYGGGGYNGIGNPRTFGGCSLDDAKNNFKSFLKGNFNEGGWNSWLKVSQIDTNNPYSVYLNLSSQLSSRVTQKKTIVDKELTWNKGFLSFRKCENKNMKPQDCPIVTPGNLIEDQLSKTLNLSKDRLVLAEKFDQVLDVVINQLINTALSKLLN